MQSRTGPSTGKGTHPAPGGDGRSRGEAQHIKVLAIEEESSDADAVAQVLKGTSDIRVLTSASAKYDPSLAVRSLHPQVLVLNMAGGAHLGRIKLGRAARECNPELGILVVAHEREFSAVKSLIQGDDFGWIIVPGEALNDRDSLAQAVRSAAGCVESARSSPSAPTKTSGDMDRDPAEDARHALTRSISEWAECAGVSEHLVSLLRSEPADAVQAAHLLLDEATRLLVSSELVEEIPLGETSIPDDPATCRRLAAELSLISGEVRVEMEVLAQIHDTWAASDSAEADFEAPEIREHIAQLRSPVLYARKLGFWQADAVVESKCPLGVSGPRYWWTLAVLAMLGVLASCTRRLMMAQQSADEEPS